MMNMISFIGNAVKMGADNHFATQDAHSPEESFDAVLTHTNQKTKTVSHKTNDKTNDKTNPKGKASQDRGETEFAPSPAAQTHKTDNTANDEAKDAEASPRITLRGADVEMDIDLSALMKLGNVSGNVDAFSSEFLKVAENLLQSPVVAAPVPHEIAMMSKVAEKLPMFALDSQESHIVDQIIQKLALKQMELHGKGKVTLALEPKELGALKIEIAMHKGAVSADILTQHPGVKEILEKNQSLLLHALSNSGLNVEQFSVNVGNFQNHSHSEDEGSSGFRWGVRERSLSETALLSGIGNILRSRFYPDGTVSLYA